MRVWYKCWILNNGRGQVTLPKDTTYSDHAHAIGGYNSGPEYDSLDHFWSTYFKGRYVEWDKFLRPRLKKTDQVLSIASGRCINESKFISTGFNITCSDLEVPDSYTDAKRLFGPFNYLKLDIVKDKPGTLFDKIVCLSLIYIFDEQQLDAFFAHVSASLKPQGELLLDSAGSEDKLLSRLYDSYLILECHLIWLISRLLGKSYQLFRQPRYGFKRTDREIIEQAARHGLVLIQQENFDSFTELSRSYVLMKLSNRLPFVKKLISPLGRKLPYIRMFQFRKATE